MATCSSILAGLIPRRVEPSRLYSPRGHKELERMEYSTAVDISHYSGCC